MAPGSPGRARGLRARPWAGAVVATGLLAMAGALGGCGGTTASSSSAGGPQLALSSPAVTSRGAIPALYTCAGKNVSPPLIWGKIPAGTSELALFLLDLGHTESAGGGETQAKLKVGWVVRGLEPTLHGMSAGKLPAGAVAGRQRYSVCPPKGGTGEYMFRLYALPRRLSIARSLSDLEVFKQINRASTTAGDFLSSYTRG
jgi:phosphatidylethanolamine-binding protein (PEBP) family uncharacterized protein